MPYIIDNNCIACGTCINECPNGAIKKGDIYSIDAEKCIECGTCHSMCVADAIHKVEKGQRNDLRLCPCCRKEIKGRVDKPEIRKGAKIGTKFAVKQGLKYVTGGTIATAAGTVGATVGSVIPVVGTFLGYVAGYTIGHVAQEIALDAAYDSIEEKYAKKTFYFYCPECNLNWNSTEYSDRNIVIKNFIGYYEANKKQRPFKPAKFSPSSKKYENFFNVLYLCVFFLFVLFVIPIFRGYGNVAYGEWIGFASPAIFIDICVILGLSIYLWGQYEEYKKKLQQYYTELAECESYNQELKQDLLLRLNSVIGRCAPRLGESVNTFPTKI